MMWPVLPQQLLSAKPNKGPLVAGTEALEILKADLKG
jgi:hypothetical protein